MRLSYLGLFSGLVLAGGLLGCGGQEASKPMKGEVMKPGNESAPDKELNTKAGKKNMGGVPEGPEMPDALKKGK
jgi:hypothetical protein